VNEPIIAVERLSKKYRIRHDTGLRYVALRDVLASKMSASLRWLKRPTRPVSINGRSRDFWALKDVSFEVHRGEVLGIIGRNGAGKSTLLKILSRITDATEGRVALDGHVASLLEVGTGFHPELTGRENIMLNGAILGMARSEIRRKFDEIVAFAEVEPFVDTPVKRYSSGMYMRLAFAVAAHLDPEILVIDEVLAVGDAQFQKKCLGRMSEVAAGGRTVLFVSHNMNAIESLCTEAIYLDRGRLRAYGRDVRGIVSEYLSDGDASGEWGSAWTNETGEIDHPVMQPLYFAVVDERGHPLMGPIRNDEPIFVIVRADIRQLDPALCIGFSLYNQDSHLLFSSLNTDMPERLWPKLQCGTVELRCAFPTRLLNEGAYRVELHCSLHCREWLAQPGHSSPAVHFSVLGGLSDSPYWMSARPGLLAPVWAWQRV
jgi:lipopolysaccharide transport system ATP-binding protein